MERQIHRSEDDDDDENELINAVRHEYHDYSTASQSGVSLASGRTRGSDGPKALAVRRVRWPFPAFVMSFAVTAGVLLGTDNALDRLYIELRMLRGVFLLVLLPFMFLINLRVWKKAEIDYVHLLGLDKVAPTPCKGKCLGGGQRQDNRIATPYAVGGVTSVLSVLWIASVLVVIYCTELRGPLVLSHSTPFVLWVLVALVVCNPFPVFYQRSRQWFCYVLWRIIAAPFYPVRFVDTWVADQITSLTLVLLDFEYTMCFMIKVQWLNSYLDSHDVCLSPTIGIRQILGALPSWFRFAQCLRAYRDTRKFTHLLNAGKYFSTFPVVIAGSLVAKEQQSRGDFHSLPIFYIWLALALIHAVYVFAWDVIMDWGLLRQQDVNPFLRSCLLYSRKWVYFTAIFLDMILRFAWTMKMSISVSSWFGSDKLLLLLAVGEVLRRFMWNFFRLEHEQVKQLEEQHMSTEDNASFSSSMTGSLSSQYSSGGHDDTEESQDM